MKQSSSVKRKAKFLLARHQIIGTAQSALHFTPWQTCSIEHHLNFSGRYPDTLQLKTISTQTGHIILMNDNRLPKTCIIWRISQREMSSWWTTATIQRCSQTTPKGYTHHRWSLGEKPYWRKDITKIPAWSQSPSWLSWCFCPYHLLCQLRERL